MSLNWRLSWLPSLFRLLIPLNQQSESGSYGAGWVDWRKWATILQWVKEDYMWIMGDPLGSFLVLSCPAIKSVETTIQSRQNE